MKMTNFDMIDDVDWLQRRLAAWYTTNKRDLPWRHTRNPYLIWISEIILQQTQVAQGMDYYRRFVAQFPTVAALAEASQDEVLKAWQGLGYYSRARNLHASAQMVMQRFGGQFPQTYAEVLSLKGVGEYTAAAVCSFAYRLPYATVDGNVYRVLARYFGCDVPIDTTEGKRFFAQLAQTLLDRHQPDVHNQALMEFGALQCTPASPQCNVCPLCDSCAAWREQRVAALPVKQGKTHVRDRYFYYFLIEVAGKTFVRQRGANDVWQGLYEFPLVEVEEPLSVEQLLTHADVMALVGNAVVQIEYVSPVRKHVLSHQRIFAQCIKLTCDAVSPALAECVATDIGHLDHFPVSRLMERLMTDALS